MEMNLQNCTAAERWRNGPPNPLRIRFLLVVTSLVFLLISDGFFGWRFVPPTLFTLWLAEGAKLGNIAGLEAETLSNGPPPAAAPAPAPAAAPQMVAPRPAGSATGRMPGGQLKNTGAMMSNLVPEESAPSPATPIMMPPGGSKPSASTAASAAAAASFGGGGAGSGMGDDDDDEERPSPPPADNGAVDSLAALRQNRLERAAAKEQELMYQKALDKAMRERGLVPGQESAPAVPPAQQYAAAVQPHAYYGQYPAAGAYYPYGHQAAQQPMQQPMGPDLTIQQPDSRNDSGGGLPLWMILTLGIVGFFIIVVIPAACAIAWMVSKKKKSPQSPLAGPRGAPRPPPRKAPAKHRGPQEYAVMGFVPT